MWFLGGGVDVYRFGSWASWASERKLPMSVNRFAVPLDAVQVLGLVDVFRFPATTRLTEVVLRPGLLHLRYDKQGVWPPVQFETIVQEATVWILARIRGQWVAAGMERLRPNQPDKPEGPDPRQFVTNWVEGRNFGPFNSYSFSKGEPLGVCVVAGVSRLEARFTIEERSNVVVIPFPGVEGIEAPPFLWEEGIVEQPGPGQPAPGPTDPAPSPPPPPTDLDQQLDAIHAWLDSLSKQVDASRVEILARIDKAEAEFKAAAKQLGGQLTGGGLQAVAQVAPSLLDRILGRRRS